MSLRVLALPLLLLTLAGISLALSVINQDLRYSQLETELGFWGRDRYHPTAATIELTEQGIVQLLGERPAHPGYLGLQANYFAWQSFWADDPAGRATFGRRAVASQYLAAQSRPAHRQSWSKMLEYAARSSCTETLRENAQSRLQVLEPKRI